MKKEIQISNINELIEFIENSDLSIEQYCKIINQILRVLTFSETKKELIHDLKEYWAKFGNVDKKERPIFLGINDPLK